MYRCTKNMNCRRNLTVYLSDSCAYQLYCILVWNDWNIDNIMICRRNLTVYLSTSCFYFKHWWLLHSNMNCRRNLIVYLSNFKFVVYHNLDVISFQLIIIKRYQLQFINSLWASVCVCKQWGGCEDWKELVWGWKIREVSCLNNVRLDSPLHFF